MVLKVAKSSVEDKRKKPLKPQIEIFNKYKTNQFVNGIELTLDSYFSVKGIVEIHVGDEIILDANDTDDLRQYKLFQVPIDSKILKPEQSIKIYVWNELDDDIVLLTANIALEETARQSSLSGVPADPDQINRHISGTESGGTDSTGLALFEHKGYFDEIVTALVNMNGNRNLIITMSGSLVVAPSVDCDSGLSDADYNYPIGGTSGSQIIIKTNECRFDLGEGNGSGSYDINFNPSSTSQMLLDSFSCQIADDPACSGSGCDGTQYTVETNANYTRTYSVYGYDNADFSDAPKTILQDVTASALASMVTTKRYIKVIESMSINIRTASISSNHKNNIGGGDTCTRTVAGSHAPIPSTFTPNDLNQTGGSAELSFEIKDASGEWQTLIPSGEFGLISYGVNVLREIGESVSNHVLPSSQSLFRAVMKVVGGIQIGVSIIKVA